MNKYNVLNSLHRNYLVAVIRGKSKNDAINIVNQIINGGIKNIEVTFTTPQAEDVIRQLTLENEKDLIIGAGTVMDEVSARLAISNGAQYIVSPHFDRKIAEICNLYATPYLPGCGSVTEITEALKSGVDVVKIFPGDVLGVDFIKAVNGPLPQAHLMPSGGVSLENMGDWYTNNAFAIGIGGGLTKGATTSEDTVILENAKKFVKQFEKIKG